jgi:hypothetical protein
VFGLGEEFPTGTVLVGGGDLPVDLFGEDLLGQPEVGVEGGLCLG